MRELYRLLWLQASPDIEPKAKRPRRKPSEMKHQRCRCLGVCAVCTAVAGWNMHVQRIAALYIFHTLVATEQIM